MRGNDIFLVVFILLVFAALYAYTILVVALADIQDNWPIYRCNPMVMPFADQFGISPGENFAYCAQNMQSSIMGTLLEPLNNALSIVNTLGAELTESLNNMRHIIGNLRMLMGNILGDVFGVFINILIQIQKIFIALKDTIGKTIGVTTTLLYTIEGVVISLGALWNTRPMKAVKAICFHPDTQVKLQTDKSKKMCDLDLGDVLHNGSVICAVLKIKNFVGNNNNNTKCLETTNDNEFKQVEELYKMQTSGYDPVYVTGSHLVQTPSGKWIDVKDHPDAQLTDKKTKWLTCVITDDHLVPINGYMFHDWEDDYIKPSYETQQSAWYIQQSAYNMPQSAWDMLKQAVTTAA